MNQTLLTVLIDLTVPALALVLIALESRWTAKISAPEPEEPCPPVTLLPHPTVSAVGAARKARLNSSFLHR